MSDWEARERRDALDRARQLASKGLEPWQISARTGVDERTARRMVRRYMDGR